MKYTEIKQEIILNLKEDSNREENIERLTSLMIGRICDARIDTLQSIMTSIENSSEEIKKVKDFYCKIK